MADSKKMFSATIYDTSDKAQRLDDWDRRSEVYVIANSLEEATKLAQSYLSEDEVLIGVSEMMNARFIM